MKITKPGVVQKAYDYNATCVKCGCEFSFNRDDEGVREHYEGDDGYGTHFCACVQCPQEGCDNLVIWYRRA